LLHIFLNQFTALSLDIGPCGSIRLFSKPLELMVIFIDLSFLLYVFGVLGGGGGVFTPPLSKIVNFS
jgi:hypothetical protein